MIAMNCRGAPLCARFTQDWLGAQRCAPTILIALFLMSPFVSAASNVGTSGAAFLEIAPGARPVGMGQAYTGVADDIDAIYWNPAGLARMAHPELEAMH